MKKANFLIRIFVTVLFCFNAFNGNAQPPMEWQRCFGGGNVEQNSGITPTLDGGYITVGTSNSVNGDVTGNHGNEDLWVVKMDSTGAIEWQKSYGGSVVDVAFGIVQASDGGYVVHGFKYSQDGDITCGDQYWVFKINNAGTLTWQQCFKIALGNRGGNPSVIETPDHGFVVATGCYASDWGGASGGTDFLLIKLDSSGNSEWHRCLGGESDECATSIKCTKDGGYIIAGYSNSSLPGFHNSTVNGNYFYDFYVVKTDGGGNIIWQKCYGGNNEDIAYSVVETPDGGYSVAGYTYSNEGDVTGLQGLVDFWVIRLSGTGDLLWNKCYGGSSLDQAQTILNTTDNGFIVGGYTSSNDYDVSGMRGSSDYWLIKINSEGALNWQKCLGGSSTEYFTGAAQTRDGGFIVSGTSASNDSDVSGNRGNQDYWIVKLYPESYMPGAPGFQPFVKVFPSPAQNDLNIKANVKMNAIAVMSIDGRKIYTSTGGLYEMKLDISKYPTGIYLINVNNSLVTRFLKE